MTAHSRRGACPGLSAPMPTGDGLLVRLRPAAPVPLAALAGICEAARRYGNGIIEISARGSLQVRGLTPQSAPLFASAVEELGVVIHEGIQVIAGLDQPIRRENTPVAKRMDMRVKPAADDSITSDVAAELRWAIGKAGLTLSPKISIAVDDGGMLHLDALSADVRLRAAGPAEAPRFTVGLGGDGASATWLGSVARKDAVGAVLGILTIIAANGPAARASEVLRAGGVEAFRSVSEAVVEPSSAPPQRMLAEVIGLHSARDGTVAVGIGLAFGHTHADALAEIVRVAAVHGAHTVWPAPGRALLLIGVSAPYAQDITAAAERLGFVAHAGDPRRRIAACPGAPTCASGLIPSRALASVLTAILEPVLKTEHNGVCVHISGCDKGCAHPMRAALTVVGTPRGCGIVHDGTARTAPGHYVDPANLGDEISRIATKTGEAAHG
jgi:precorrin-3B synthase